MMRYYCVYLVALHMVLVIELTSMIQCATQMWKKNIFLYDYFLCFKNFLYVTFDEMNFHYNYNLYSKRAYLQFSNIRQEIFKEKV